MLRHPRLTPPRLVALFLLAAVLLVFGRTGDYPFITYDDDVYVYENPIVSRGLTSEGVAAAFSTFHAGNWHPLTWISHMLDISLFGMAPGAHHLVNVAFHAANVLLLFLFFRRTSGSLWRSAFVAALFGLHPLHVESVAWVSERKDVLCAFFFLLTLLAYARYVDRPCWQRYLPVGGLFVLALLSKPMAVTLPPLLLLLDFWPLARCSGPAAAGKRLPVTTTRFIEKVPLFLLSGASCVVTALAQKAGGAITTLEMLPIATRIENAIYSYAAYIGQALWPAKLSVFYPYPDRGISAGAVAAAGLLLLGATGTALLQARRRPWMAVGWFWFLGMLVPASGLIQAGIQSRADRYTYLPLIGLFLIAAWGGEELARRARIPRSASLPAATAILFGLACAAWTQAGFWKDSTTLFTRSLEVVGPHWATHMNLGNALLFEGRHPEALAQFEETLKLRPGFHEAHTNAGVALLQLGRTDEAIRHLKAALRERPDDYMAWGNLADAFKRKGAKAWVVFSYEQALRIRPDSAEARRGLEEALAGFTKP